MTFIMLLFDLRNDKLFHFVPVEFDEIKCEFFHDFVKRSIFSIFEFLSSWVSVFVDDDENFFWFGHFETDYFHYFVENWWVNRG